MGEGSYCTITVKEGKLPRKRATASGSTDSLDSMFRQQGAPETYLLGRRKVRSPVFAQRSAGARSGNDRCPNEPFAAFATGAGRRESQAAASHITSGVKQIKMCRVLSLVYPLFPTRRPYATSPVASLVRALKPT